MPSRFELTIQPHKGWQPIDFKEVLLYRELLGFLVWRDIKIRYRQTLLGGAWAILQPLLAMFIFTYVFHRLAGVKSDGPPYPLFAFAGVSAWTFFSTALSQSSNSLIQNHALVSKVYFPRFFIPLGAVGALLLDLCFSMIVMAAMMVYYHWHITAQLLILPVFVITAALSAAGLGLILSAMNVRFRDVKYAVPFIVQMGMFVTPVIYPIRYIPQKWQMLMGLNPMTGVVLGFRHALLGSSASWQVMGLSISISVLVFVAGLYYFRRMERVFADVI